MRKPLAALVVLLGCGGPMSTDRPDAGASQEGDAGARLGGGDAGRASAPCGDGGAWVWTVTNAGAGYVCSDRSPGAVCYADGDCLSGACELSITAAGVDRACR